MWLWVRVGMGAAAIALAIWMIVLFTGGRSLEYRNVDNDSAVLTVRCQSLAGVADSGTSASTLDTVDLTYNDTGGAYPESRSGDQLDVYREVNARCDRERTIAAATIGLLAVPTAVLASLSLRRRPSPLAVAPAG